MNDGSIDFAFFLFLFYALKLWEFRGVWLLRPCFEGCLRLHEARPGAVPARSGDFGRPFLANVRDALMVIEQNATS